MKQSGPVEAHGVARAPPREVEQRAHQLGHRLGAVGDDSRAVARVGELPVGDHPRAHQHHVHRRAQLVGDARGQLADGGEAIGVPQSFERLDARLRLAHELRARVGQLRGHCVERDPQRFEFVAAGDVHERVRVAGAHAVRHLLQPRDRPRHQYLADEPGEHERGERQQRRRAEHQPHERHEVRFAHREVLRHHDRPEALSELYGHGDHEPRAGGLPRRQLSRAQVVHRVLGQRRHSPSPAGCARRRRRRWAW